MTFREISEVEWIKNDEGVPEYLCQLPFNVLEMERIYGFEFSEYQENGLGTLYSCLIQISDKKFWLRGFDDKEQKVEPVAVYVRNINNKTANSLACLLKFLSLSPKELVEINDVQIT